MRQKYIHPITKVVKIEIARLCGASDIYNTEKSASEALGRRGGSSSWDDDEEDY